MAQVVSLVYSIFLIAAYTSVISFACCLHFTSRWKSCAPLSGLFAFYVLDSLIILLTEHSEAFAAWYNRVFIYAPTIKTILLIGIAFCAFAVWNTLTDRSFSPAQVVLLILFGLWLLLVPMFTSGPVGALLYYEGYQVLNFVICGAGLRKLRQVPPEERQTFPALWAWLRWLLIFTVVFSVGIVLEDIHIVFRTDNYELNNLYLYSRCSAEDVLRLCYVGFFYRLFALRQRQLRLAPSETPAPEEDAEDTVPEEPAVPAPPAPEMQAEYKRLKYVQHLGLTDRESEIFSLMVQGHSNQQISDELVISSGTVKAHIHNIYQKAGITHRYELLRLYNDYAPSIPEPSAQQEPRQVHPRQ